MSFFILQIPTLDRVPEDHPSREIENLEEFVGAFVVDSHDKMLECVFTSDLEGRARRFGTKELAFAFSQIGGLKQLPLMIVRIDGKGSA